MKLTKHEEYGVRCLMRLGELAPDSSMTIPELSRNEGISEAYTGKLLRLLRKGGFVKASRGRVGGYNLSRPASKILVGDVIKVLGGHLYAPGFCDKHSGDLDTCVRSADCSLRALWQMVQEAVDQVLSRTTIDSLLCHESDLMVQLGLQQETGDQRPRP